MLWLAAQVFVLCLVSFLAGAGITALAMRRRPEEVQAVDEDEPVLVKVAEPTP